MGASKINEKDLVVVVISDLKKQPPVLLYKTLTKMKSVSDVMKNTSVLSVINKNKGKRLYIEISLKKDGKHDVPWTTVVNKPFNA